MSKMFSQKGLNKMICDGSILQLNPRCHCGEATEVSYNKDTGSVLVVCAECQQPVIEIKVAMR